MGIFRKIITALRGAARETGEAIVDANGIRIFEQEIKDAEHNLNKARQDLTEVMAKEMQASRKCEQLAADIEKHEGYATAALDKGDEALALEVAAKIAELQGELAIQTKSREDFSSHVTRLKDMIKRTEKSLADMKRQLVMVKTTESVHKATKSISENYAASGSRLLSAKESLDRIQKRQQDLDDRLAAGALLQDEEDGASLEDKLKAAGIGQSNNQAADILAQLRAKRG